MDNGDTDLDKPLKDMKIDQCNINILLLGETGVGKSTFINAVANYLSFADMESVGNGFFDLIPTRFSVTDKHNVSREVITKVKDKNEFLEIGASATQDVKTYVFPIYNNQAQVRLIDTPGMGDTRGINQDDINSENILSYISQIHELHAICFLFKPNMSRSTVFFQYCFSQILSRLDKSASKNIIFVFTNTRGSDYGPGDSIVLLKKVIGDIKKRSPHIDIPLNRNIFCFDNEAFRYLVAMRDGVEFDSASEERFKESWKKSSDECWKLIKYIVGDAKNAPLKPHHVKNTSAVNEARRMIVRLSQPLADIVQNINQNLDALQRHETILNSNSKSLDDLKAKLYIPVIVPEVTKLTQPTTVCTSRSCAEVYQVAGKSSWHYKKRCHEPCHLPNVPEEIIGSPKLIDCAAMNRSDTSRVTCRVCTCMYSVHMHIYYMTKVVEKREKDLNIERDINDKRVIKHRVRELIREMTKKKNELEEEHRIIVKCTARFAHFLQNNAITPFNDSYKEYIEYLINRERSLGDLCDMQTVDYLKKTLLEYEEEKKVFDEALAANKKIGKDECISPKAIQDSINELYKLKHNGKKIKELYECQKTAVRKEHENTEYIHKPITRRDDTMKKNDKKEKKDKDKKKEKKEKTHDRKENKEKKDQKKNKPGGQTKSETQHSFQQRSRSPPPSYQDLNRLHQLSQGPFPSQQGPRPSQDPYPPPLQYTGGFGSHLYSPNYPGGPIPQPPSYGEPRPNQPPTPGAESYGPFYYRDSNPHISVTVVEKGNTNTPRAPDPRYQYPPSYYGHPPYSGHNYPPPPAGYCHPPTAPDYYGTSYNPHHGVNRQTEDSQRGGNNSKRYNDRNRGYRAGRGGVKKNYNKTSKKCNKKKESDTSESSSS